VRNPIPPVFVDDMIAVVEDYFSSGVSASRVWSQISLYHIGEGGKIAQVEIFNNIDQSQLQQNKLISILNKYFEAVNGRNLDRLREIFDEAYTIFDPVGKPSKNINEEYSRLFNWSKFRIDTDLERTYVAGDRVALISFVTLTLKDFRDENLSPIQIFRIENDKIKNFDSYVSN